jgi:hypothetical protein
MKYIKFLQVGEFGMGDTMIIRAKRRSDDSTICYTIMIVGRNPRVFQVQEYACADIQTLSRFIREFKDDYNLTQMQNEDIDVQVVQVLPMGETQPMTLYDQRSGKSTEPEESEESEEPESEEPESSEEE